MDNLHAALTPAPDSNFAPSPQCLPVTPKSLRTSYLPPTPAEDDGLVFPPHKRRRLNDDAPPSPTSNPTTPAHCLHGRTAEERVAVKPESIHLRNDTRAEEPFDKHYDLLPNNSEDWLSGFTNVHLGDGINLDFENQTHLEDQVCFGMVYDLQVTINDDLETRKIHGVLPALIDGNGQVILIHDAQAMRQANSHTSPNQADGYDFCIGKLDTRDFRILNGLRSDPRMVLQPLCRVKMRRYNGGAPRKEQAVELSATLSINLYGPFELFDQVDKYLEDCDVCLQDPVDCDRNVRYRNPHRLSGLARDAPFTLEEQLCTMEVCKEVLDRSTGYLSGVGKKDYLPQADTPHALATELYSHQRQGLSFMLNRERGWDLEGQWPDVWKRVQLDGGGTLYMNTITDETSAEAPIPFRGGILADHMGLGKTLSMIALIASDYDATGQSAMRPSLSSPSQVVDSVRATLIVVPRALLYTWDQQLKRHVGSTLKWLFYHGPKRSLSKEQLATNHIVLTTYQTVSSEWKRLDSSYGSLFSVYWNRIILDEAHVIRDRLTLCAQAICQLRAERRWAVSGTPIQNRLTDLSTILAFLQAYPYNDPKVFNEDISQLWKSGSEAAAADRLKKIIHCISLRRSSSTITLPKRTDEVHRLQFSRAERKEYDKIQANTLFHLNTASSVGTSAAKQFFHVLKQINSLRQICNLGLLAFSAAQVEDNSIDEFVDFGWNEKKAQDAFSGMLASGAVTCLKCKKDVLNNDDTASNDEQVFHVSECMQVIHTTCLGNGATSFCKCEPPCDIAPVSLTHDCKDTQPQIIKSTGLGQELPTKIRAVVDDIEAFRTTKSVVFSQWLSTLDQIAQALTARSIPFLRYDSNINPANRVQALEKFQNDSTFSVILFTISCGAVGLDLTAANRAYIIEPHWNPAVEEQALARIHRLGQTREITTIRYVMDNTYEDHILKIQTKKRDLVDVLLAQKKSQGHKARLQSLQSLLG